MKKLWLQYIVLILCAATALLLLPAFAVTQITPAQAEVDWQTSSSSNFSSDNILEDGAYENEFGDIVIPLPPELMAPSASSQTGTNLSSIPSSYLSSAAITSSKPASSRPTLPSLPDYITSVLPIPSSKPTSSFAAGSKPSASSKPSGPSSNSEAPPQEDVLTVFYGGKAVSEPVSSLLPKIVEAEIGGGSPVEAIKAQAVAAHTAVKYYNLQGKMLSVALKAPTAKTIAACKEVQDFVMTVNGAVVYAPYCAATAGRTNASAEVWGGPLSHLQSVESKYDSEDKKNWNSKQTIPVSTVKAKLQAAGIAVTGEPGTWFTVLNYTAGGYNKEMKICGQTDCTVNGKKTAITGRVVRENLLGLKSAWFTWEVKDNSFIFTTRGYGHGVGMSQMGAVGYANHGYTYKQIVTHYYTGVKLVDISSVS